MKCTKIKFDKLGAMMTLAKIKSPKINWNRRENRYYYCKICKAYHLTSQS